MNDIIEMLEQDKQRLLLRIEQLEAEVATCRELRKYDRIEIERMRLLLEKAKR